MAITKRACGLLVMVGAVVIAGTAMNAAAAVTILSQERRIEAAAGAGGPGARETIVWTQGGFFSDSVSVSYDTGEPNPNTAYATQTSMIGSDYFWMTGEVGGEDRYGSGGSGAGVGESTITITFVLDQATPVSIRASRTFSGSSELAHVLVYNAANVEVIRLSEFGMQGETYDGILAPGQYRVNAACVDGAAGLGTGIGRSTYAISMSIPTASTGAMMLMPLVVAGRRRRRRVDGRGR